ncbi:MAG: DUF885 family protein [Bacteroidota bacterium]
MKIRGLREKTEKALGENSDFRKFHDQVLETGCIPLASLEEKKLTIALNSMVSLFTNI